MKTFFFPLTMLMVYFSFLTTASAYQLTFTPRSSASLEYTDNADLSEKNKEDELTTVASVGFTIALLERTMGLEINYDPSYVYSDFDDSDSWRHNADLFAWTDLGKNTRLELNNRFLLTEDPTGDEDLVRDDEMVVVIPGDTTVRRGRNEYYTNTAIAQLKHQFGIDNFVYTRFLYSLLRNDDPGIEDNERYQPSVGLTTWFGNRYGLETVAEYERGKFSRDSDFQGIPTDDFDNWTGALKLMRMVTKNISLFAQYQHIYRDYDSNLSNDYHLYSPSTGFQYSMENGLHFVIGLGYFIQDFDGIDNEEGLFLTGEVRKSWNYKWGVINLAGSGGLDQNSFGAQRIDLERFISLGADARYDFFRNLAGNVFIDFRYSDPVNTDESDGSGGIEDQKTYRTGAGITYSPLRWMALNLNYQFSKYEASAKEDINFRSESNDKYDENRVTFMITLQPDRS